MHEASLEEKKQPFFEHLIELRACLIKAFIGWAITSVLVYLYSDNILEFLINPLRPYLPLSQKVYFKSLTEVFINEFKLSVIIGFIIGSPFIFYQLWTFIAPGLYPHEKKWIKLTVIISSFFFLLGDLVAYYLFLPFILKFFYSFGEKFLIFKPYLKEYMDFLLKIFFIFGIFFQIPSVIFLLNKLEIVSLEQLKKFRPYAIILSFIVSSLITTGGDPIYQILLALPLTFLYEVGIILTKLIPLRR
ncbi:MAG: twin-arginine translocase subunit TatC [Caldimicrobium sp.]|jgi:sec-independent protein translocase protein TatC